jgi:intracellular sulfur oxidation DsrE/DsrF family protein
MISVQAADEPKYRLVLHVTQEDPEIFKQVLNMANNVPKQVGVDNIKIEIVAQGPGLKLLTKGSPETERIASLVPYGNVQYSACGETMAAIKRKTGKEPELLPDVVTVSGGVVRVMDLQKEGYAYIRP